MADIEAEKKEILRNMESLEDAENRKDIEGILELVTEDFVFVLRGVKYEGKESLREYIERSFQTFISSKHVPLRVEVSSSGDMAWLLGSETTKRERDEGIIETKGDYIVTFRKVEGKWKQVAVCVTQITITGVVIYRIVDGKVVERWSVVDMLDFYRQLGVTEYRGFPDEIK